MKKVQRILLFTVCLCLIAVPALASGAPTSQFGFSGWPYRANTGCATCDQHCASCQSNADCDACDACNPAPEATQPPVQPTAAPVQPTAAPIQPTAAPTVKPTPSTEHYTTDDISLQEEKVWNLLNADRAANGLPALPIDAELSRYARLKSCDMKANHYFSHTSPTYGNASAMLTSFGYAFHGVGENIAHHANVTKAEAAFMSSEGHRHNILGSQWTKVGVGVCIDDNGFVYVTQLFAR